jgi:glutamate racemase
LTVLAEIRDRLPYENTVYFGDTARVPYGVRDPAEVREFAFEIITYLTDLDVKLVVVACNSASAVALEAAQGEFDVPLVGVIEPGARAAAVDTINRRVGVLATQVTVESGAYRRAVHNLDAGIGVHEQPCPEFVPLIERGVVDGPELEKVARGYLDPLMSRQVDAVILGCTHYPLISATINRILGPEVRLISSAGQTALEVGRILSRRGYLRRPRDADDLGASTYVCSADPAEFAALGGRFLGEEIEAVAPAAVI